MDAGLAKKIPPRLGGGGLQQIHLRGVQPRLFSKAQRMDGGPLSESNRRVQRRARRHEEYDGLRGQMRRSRDNYLILFPD